MCNGSRAGPHEVSPKAFPGGLAAGCCQHDPRITAHAFIDTVCLEKPIQQALLQIIDPPDLLRPRAFEYALDVLTRAGFEKLVQFLGPQVEPQVQPTAVLKGRIVRHQSRERGDNVRITFIGIATNVGQFMRDHKGPFDVEDAAVDDRLLRKRIEYTINPGGAKPWIADPGNFDPAGRLPVGTINNCDYLPDAPD